jgi:SpoVK/Ycf46/Vps4 family AAA+-type ATPase
MGETEKNLGRDFDKAEALDVVVFFDEADALFGKRTILGDVF